MDYKDEIENLSEEIEEIKEEIGELKKEIRHQKIGNWLMIISLLGIIWHIY